MFVAKYLYLFVCMFFFFQFFLPWTFPSNSFPLLFLSAESSSEVQVGIDELMNITVSLENSEENSYNTHVILTYPAGLSYRKLTILQVSRGSPSGFLGDRTVFDFSLFCAFDLNQGRIECNSLDSDNGLSRGKTDCTIDKPIFRSKIKVGRPLVWLYRWTASHSCWQSLTNLPPLKFNSRLPSLSPMGSELTVGSTGWSLSRQTLPGVYVTGTAVHVHVFSKFFSLNFHYFVFIF